LGEDGGSDSDLRKVAVPAGGVDGECEREWGDSVTDEGADDE
jgi:hypothetical protein